MHTGCSRAYERFEETIGIIRRGKAKKDRKYNDQAKGDKGTNNDIQKFYY
jgi:hypothetical protein